MLLSSDKVNLLIAVLTNCLRSRGDHEKTNIWEIMAGEKRQRRLKVLHWNWILIIYLLSFQHLRQALVQ